MLSFSRRHNCTFEGAEAPSQATLDGRATSTLQVPARTTIPERPERRERFLTALAVEYLCRWRVCMPEDSLFGDEEAETTAFYAAIADLDEPQRQRLVGSAGKSETPASDVIDAEQFDLVDPGTACVAGALHDWCADSVQKQYFRIKNRPHVLVHYAHPCAHGRSVLPLSDEDVAKRQAPPAKIAPQNCTTKSAPRGLTDAMMIELMGAVNKMRQRTTPDAVAEHVESECAVRQRRARRQRRKEVRAAEAIAERTRDESRAVCDALIERARKTASPYDMLRRQRFRSAGGSTSEDDDTFENDTSDGCADASETWNDSDTECGNKNVDGESSSDTFSSSISDDDNDDPQPARTRPRTWAQVARMGEQAAVEKSSSDESDSEVDVPSGKDAENSQTVEHASCSAPVATSDAAATQDNVAEHAHSAKNEETADTAEIVDSAHEVESAKVVPRRQALRQTTVEALVPVCEADDTLAFFDQLECPYVLVWAPEPAAGTKERRRLHILRKQEKEVGGFFFGLYKSKMRCYHLVATIEALV